MIDIPITIEGKERVLKFRKMRPEEAAEWAAKLQSRLSFKQALEKSLELQEKIPADERDFDKYLETSDKITELVRQVVESSKNVKKFVIEPAPAEVEKILADHMEITIQAFEKYFEKCFPSEEDEKKSSGRS